MIVDKPPSAYLPEFLFDVIAHSVPALNCLASTSGPERVYLGSDYPFVIGLPDPVGTVDAIETTDAADKERIKEGNVRTALRL